MNTLGLSQRAGIVGPSPTLGITAKANAMRAAGVDVVSFGAGEPDFNTPEAICEAAVEAIHAGKTKYTPSAGIPALRQAVADKLARDNGITVKPEQVVVSCGAKHSLYNTMQMLIEPGDEVVLIAPYWMTYADQVRLAGGIPVVVRTSAANQFVPDYESLRAAISPRTKAIVVNSPSNPSGAVLPRETIKEIAMLALRHGLWIIADEIYERLIYGSTHQSIAGLGQDVAEQTVTINGWSKTYSMTGWRLGFAAAPLPLAKAMSNFQDQVTSNPTSFVQVAAIEAYKMTAEQIEPMRAEFEARRDLIVGLLREIPGVQIDAPKGAFYVLPDFSAYLGVQFATDVELSTYLLETAHVATVPGSVFEAPGHLRLSYATSREDIVKGVGWIKSALAQPSA